MQETDFAYAFMLTSAAQSRFLGLEVVNETEDYERQEQACPWLRDGRD